MLFRSEAGRDRVGKGGVIRDPAVHAAVCVEVVEALDVAGLGVVGCVASPILGADGNREFLVQGHHGRRLLTDDEVVAVALDGTVPATGAPNEQNGA